ncbi:MAG: glycoside hydrolase family 43 protein [Planctomycetota bacterium]|nr:glycoside hydrolase family 43 protein [Planctomycetota bacterium]
MERSHQMAALAIVLLAGVTVCSADEPAADDPAAPLIFSSFRGNGEDGLHLAWSQDGYTWTPLRNDKPLVCPEVGGGLMRDPQILQGPDGTFHMVWTTAWSKHGVGYANSKDLIHWSKQKLLDVMKNEPQARNVWAPEIFYDATQKQFMIFWASTIPGRFPAADKTGDDGYNHRIYFTVTTEFDRLEPARLLYEPGFNVIDATLVQDGKRFVMFLKDETRHPPAKNLRVATAETPTGPYGPPSAPITGKYWAEGPTAIKLDDKWFVYFDRYTEHRYGLVTSKDLLHWDDESDKVRFPADHRHGSVLQVSREILKALMEP